MAADKQELQERFWKALESDRTVMLGCEGVYPRPMTAQAEHARGPIWFFTAQENDLAEACARVPKAGLMMLTSKDHELFATAGGSLRVDTDPAVVERLWNPFVAAWYTGKDDPKLRLLRFDPDGAEIWLNASSLFAGVKLLLGIDPKTSYRDNVARVKLAGWSTPRPSGSR